ncbi:MAG: ATP-binding protein [Rubrivivax sp.]|nr:ATP-binding protein [Rubrivivax sp.]
MNGHAPATSSAAPGGAATAAHAQVDARHPWPGLAAYDERASDYFKGREDEAQALARLVQASNLVVLYGRSGLGKSSLLQAGLFPLLRKARMLPVYLRVDHGAGAPDVLEQIARRLTEEAAQYALQITPRGEGESLWRWLHRSDFELATHDNWPLQPVFVLDQFEEVFAHTERGGRMQATLATLADLAGNRISDEVAGDREATRGLDVARHNYRMLFSFREDYLPEIRVWERSLPALLRHYLRLEPMSAARAEAAVQAAGKAVLDDGAAGAIVRFVGNLGSAGRGGRDDIEPVLLSLTCTRLNLRRGAERINPQLVEVAGPNILHDFYAEALAGMPERVHRFIEDHLIQGERSRGSYSRAEALSAGLLTESELDLLTRERRLLRIESQGGEPRIELIHDRLVDVVRLARDRHAALQAAQAATEAERRQATEQLAAQAVQLRRNRNGLIVALAGVAVLLAAVALVARTAWRNSERAEANATAARAAASAALAAQLRAREQEQRATQAQKRAEEAAGQLKQQLDFFAFNVTGNLRAEQLIAKSREADQALRDLLAAQTERDAQRRARTRLEIWAKEIDGPRVRNAVVDLGFDTVVRVANVTDVATNALWMGCGAHVEDLRLVALALLRAGVTLRWMGAVPEANVNRRAALVQVGAGQPFVGLPALGVDQAKGFANPCPAAR